MSEGGKNGAFSSGGLEISDTGVLALEGVLSFRASTCRVWVLSFRVDVCWTLTFVAFARILITQEDEFQQHIGGAGRIH